MKRTTILLGTFLVAAAAGDADSKPAAGGYRLSWRKAPADDPGVVAVLADGVLGVRRVWFGETESPAVAPWSEQIAGVSVAVPPGAAGRGVRVRAELEDGSVRRLGTFLHEDPTLVRRERWTGSGRGCPSGSVSTFSGVRPMGRGRWRYTYRAENGFDAPVTVRWPALEYLGLPGGLTVTLPAGETYTLTRVASAAPLEVQGTATSDGMPGCTPPDGASWSAAALFPATDLPTVAPVEDAAAVVLTGDDEGEADVTWTHPGGAAPPDRFVVTIRSVSQDHDPCVGPRRFCGPPTPVVPYVQTAATADGEARSLRVALPLPGVSTISVRAQRRGVSSPPAIVSVVR